MLLVAAFLYTAVMSPVNRTNTPRVTCPYSLQDITRTHMLDPEPNPDTNKIAKLFCISRPNPMCECLSSLPFGHLAHSNENKTLLIIPRDVLFPQIKHSLIFFTMMWISKHWMFYVRTKKETNWGFLNFMFVSISCHPASPELRHSLKNF